MNCPNCQAEMFSAKMTTGFAGVYLYTKDPGILEPERRSSLLCYVCPDCGRVVLQAEDVKKLQRPY